MSMVGFPLLLIPLAIYNIIAFLMPSVSFGDTLVKLKLVSGAEWPITLSDVLLALGILLLLHEVIKAARPGGKYLTDHLLSLIVFGASAAEFVMWSKFGTSTYFLLVLLAMVDFFSGIALRAQQRSTKVQAAPRAASRQVVEEPVVEEPETPPHQPHVEPAPEAVSGPVALPAEPEVPHATSVAESVLLDHPEPKPAPIVVASEPPAPVIAAPAPPPASEPTPVPATEPAAVTESEPSPQISSPDLQPGSGSETPGSPETPKH